VRNKIKDMLDAQNIKAQFYETTGYMAGWKIAQELDMDDHSALIAVGGDGTLHEIINGMMFRKDKRTLPIAFVPNGSGNDTCASLGVHSIEQAISYIKKGQTVKVDLNRCYIDADSFEEVEQMEFATEEERYSRIRFSLINAAVGFIAKCCHAAQKHKKYFGAHAYTVAGLQCFLSGEKPDKYKFSIYND